MFHMHKWSKWSQYRVGMINTRTGRTWYEARQKKSCLTCGLIKTRGVAD